MKKILPILLIIVSLFAISCNIDSAEGLFQEAGKSVRKESYTITSVLGKISSEDNVYVVGSDEGFFVFDGKKSANSAKVGSSVGTGLNARNAYAASGESTSNWKAYYYSESDDKYYSIDNEKNITEFTGIDASLYRLKSSTLEDVNDDTYAIVFTVLSGTNEGHCALFYGSFSDLTSSSVTLKETEYTDVSYIGSGIFIGYKDGTLYYFSYDGSVTVENSNKYNSHIGEYFVNKTGSIYYGGEEKKSTGLSTGTMQKLFYNGTSYYFLLNKAKEVYVGNSEGTVEAVSLPSLSNYEIKTIVSVVDSKYINAISASSGAVCINLESKSVNSGWK